jgi:hypothetical protein
MQTLPQRAFGDLRAAPQIEPVADCQTAEDESSRAGANADQGSTHRSGRGASVRIFHLLQGPLPTRSATPARAKGVRLSWYRRYVRRALSSDVLRMPRLIRRPWGR